MIDHFSIKSLVLAQDGLDGWVQSLRERPVTTTRLVTKLSHIDHLTPEENTAFLALMLATALQRLARPDSLSEEER